jgi:uncharacterized protein (DUF58 family)
VNTRAAAASLRSRLLEFAERRLPALTRLKQAESLPILLDRHRIYVLPTRFGLMLSAVLLVMLLGALNYNNNPAILLTCLLGAASYQSVFQAFRSINRVQLRAARAEPCHAGGTLYIYLYFHIDARPRHGLRLSIDGDETVFDLHPGNDTCVRIGLRARQRGWQQLGRLRLYSEYPFGLFHVWSWLHPDFSALIYPRPEANAPPLPHDSSDAQQRQARRSRGDELVMLRDYQPTDPLRSIAWKASARHDRLLVKEFEQLRGREIVLDYAALHGLDHEARIARLVRWIIQAEAAQLPYSLQLPERRIGPGLGSEHRHACLRELALLPGASA